MRAIDNKPVPPRHELIDFIRFGRIIQQFRDAGVKPFRICDEISARKDLGRSKTEASLYRSKSVNHCFNVSS